jgi:hypothetical protein
LMSGVTCLMVYQVSDLLLYLFSSGNYSISTQYLTIL